MKEMQKDFSWQLQHSVPLSTAPMVIAGFIVRADGDGTACRSCPEGKCSRSLCRVVRSKGERPMSATIFGAHTLDEVPGNLSISMVIPCMNPTVAPTHLLILFSSGC